MTVEPEEIIFPDDLRAATPIQVTAWKSRDGWLYPDEHAARWKGSTHRRCIVCSSPARKPHTLCEVHLAESRNERFNELEVAEWDEETLLCLFDSDQYFRNRDEVDEYAFEHDLKIEDLQLVLCEPNHLKQIDEDYFHDKLPDDCELGDFSPELVQKIKELNEFISTLPPSSWREGNKRVILKNEEVSN